MRQKPIQKEDIAGRAGKGARRCVWERLLRYIKFPISGLLVGVGLLIHAWQHFQRPVDVCRIDQWNPASQHDRTVRICGILTKGSSGQLVSYGVRKPRAIRLMVSVMPACICCISAGVKIPVPTA